MVSAGNVNTGATLTGVPAVAWVLNLPGMSVRCLVDGTLECDDGKGGWARLPFVTVAGLGATPYELLAMVANLGSTKDCLEQLREYAVCGAATPTFIRAGGSCLCPRCQQPYSQHPHDQRYLTPDGTGTLYPWLHVLCDGTLVKL